MAQMLSMREVYPIRTHILTRCNDDAEKLRWTMENIMRYPTNKSIWISHFDFLPGCSWSLGFERSNEPGLIISIKETAGTGIFVNFDAMISDEDHNILYEKQSSCSFDSSNDYHRFVDLKSDTYPEKLKNLTKHTLIVDLLMIAEGNNVTTDFYNYTLPEPELRSSAIKDLCDNFRAMYVNQQLTDVTLDVYGKTLSAHSSVLSARSPVFASMFKNPMLEQTQKVVNITDIDFEVLEKLLLFLYSGSFSADDFDSALKMYYAANKYGIESLRNMCAQILKSTTTVSNACRLFAFANTHDDEELKKNVMDFIQCNFKTIIQTDIWNEFLRTDLELALEIVNFKASLKFE